MMAQWCLDHYWMTFIIVMFLIYCIATIIGNILTVKNNKLKLRASEILKELSK